VFRRDGAGDGLVEHAVKESLRRGHLLGEGRDVVRRLGRVAGEHGEGPARYPSSLNQFANQEAHPTVNTHSSCHPIWGEWFQAHLLVSSASL